MFKVGDKIKVKRQFLFHLSAPTANLIKGSGTVIELLKFTARIEFCDNNIFQINFNDLELTKNKQLEFEFMGELYA